MHTTTPARHARMFLSATLLGLLIAVLVLVAPAFAATKTVQLGDNNFTPVTISIQPGDTVEWTYRGTVTHNVWAADQSWKSQDFNNTGLIEDSYSRTFNTPGKFNYYCSYHAACDPETGECFGDMWGTVIVEGAEPDPEPTGSEPQPEPTQPRPQPTTPQPQPTQPAPTGTAAPPSDPEPEATASSPAVAVTPTPDNLPTDAPTTPSDPTATEDPDLIAVDVEDRESGARSAALVFATFLVGMTAAGHIVLTRGPST